MLNCILLCQKENMSVQSTTNNANGRRFEILVKQAMAQRCYLEASKELLDLDLVVDPATRFMQDQKIAEMCALMHGSPSTRMPNVRIKYLKEIIFPLDYIDVILLKDVFLRLNFMFYSENYFSGGNQSHPTVEGDCSQKLYLNSYGHDDKYCFNKWTAGHDFRHQYTDSSHLPSRAKFTGHDHQLC